MLTVTLTAEIYKHIGKRLRELRREKQVTQARLAEIVALNRTSITNIEKGRQKLLVHTLFDLAQALGVHPSDLLPEKATSSQDSTQPRLPRDLSRDETKWLKAIIKGKE